MVGKTGESDNVVMSRGVWYTAVKLLKDANNRAGCRRKRIGYRNLGEEAANQVHPGYTHPISLLIPPTSLPVLYTS
jgi:hypothetical protein